MVARKPSVLTGSSEDRLAYVEEVLITGNGEPSVREQVRNQGAWIKANLDIPNQTNLNTRWIENANRLSWIVITITAGIFLEFGCGLLFAVTILLYQTGFIKTP